MFSSYILDIVVKEADLMPILSDIGTPLWFVINADGLPNQFFTPKVCFNMHPVWNCPMRLIIQVPDIARAYLYVTLCTFAENGTDVRGIARARVGLRSLPNGTPKQFRFPLMYTSNSAFEALQLYLIATLSSIAPTMRNGPHSGPVRPEQQFTGPNSAPATTNRYNV